MIKVYHCSPISDLTEIKPHQPRKEDSSRNAAFFAPTLRDVLMWRGKLLCERKIDPQHLYYTWLEPRHVKAWCDGLRGCRRRWHGEITLGGQIWVYEAIECEEADWLAELELL